LKTVQTVYKCALWHAQLVSGEQSFYFQINRSRLHNVQTLDTYVMYHNLTERL